MQPSPLQYSSNWSFGDLGDEAPERDELEEASHMEETEAAALRSRPTTPATPDNDQDDVVQGLLLLPAPPVAIVNDGAAIAHADALVEDDDVDPPPPQGLLGRVANFLFANIEREFVAELDDAVVEPEVAEEVADAQDAPDDEGEGDAEGPDAADMEDLEDFEGVMELLGMRGAIVGLVQNSLFCAVLVSLTIFMSVFVPYNVGRLALWLAVNPSSVVRAMFEASKFVQDVVVLFTGAFAWVLAGLVHLSCSVLGSPETLARALLTQSWDLTIGAASSIVSAVVIDLTTSASEIRNFSALSHVALLDLKDGVSAVSALVSRGFVLIASGQILEVGPRVASALSTAWTTIQTIAMATPGFLLDPNAWVIPISARRMDLPPPELASWSSMDRVVAILCGYLALALLAALYLRRGAPITSSPVGQQLEASVVDIIHQASGVTKVIVVISIEMLLFPLYCGLLLDAALLPLFEGATVMSRVAFTCNYPLTSVFVHWFVGTGYMFHFALFVSMCRKVMRRGVLCEFFVISPHPLPSLTL
jgi:E3 ubiquitin-protein ligase MARCH6